MCRSSSNKPHFTRVLENPNTECVSLESLELVPGLLVERFGEPSPGDGFKVSGEFVFTDERGNVFVIHDWKMTSLYDGAFSPEEFWDLDDIVLLQLRGRMRDRRALSNFISWLDRSLVDGLKDDQDWLAGLSSEEPCSYDDQERFVHLLQNGGDQTQIAALEAIGRIGEPFAAPKVFEILLQLLKSRQPTRPAVFGALSAFSALSHVSWVQSQVLDELNSDYAGARCNGLSALSVLGEGVWSEAVLDKFGQLLIEEATAEESLRCMSWIRPALRRASPSPTEKIVSGIVLHLTSPSAAIRGHAAHAVVTLGKDAADFAVLTPLFRMLGEADRSTRVAAEMSFKELGERAAIPGFLSHLSQSVEPQDFQVKAGALRVARNIARLTGQSEAGRSLARLINRSTSSIE